MPNSYGADGRGGMQAPPRLAIGMPRCASKRGSSPKLREWSVTLLRYRGEFLGYVQAASREAAATEAAKLFGLSEFQRRALLVQERL